MRRKALENLDLGLLLLDLGYTDGAANRLYFAVFQAAVYALERKGLRPWHLQPGSHRWRHVVVRRQVLPLRGRREDAVVFSELWRLRTKADYRLAPVSPAEIETWAPLAARFVREVTP